MIFRMPRTGDPEISVIEKVELLKRELGYSISQVRRWTGLLARCVLAEAIRGSNSIEGYDVSEENAIAVVDGEGMTGEEEETANAVLRYREAMTHVLHMGDDKHFEYSAQVLKSLHYIMLQYAPARNPGKWRSGPIFVRDSETGQVVYEGPEAEIIPALIGELIKALAESTGGGPDLLHAAMAHLNLAMIHPFSDGNGRMARCLQTLVLARSGSMLPQFNSIEEYLGRNRRRYYDVLAEVGKGRWQPDRSATPWIRFCLTAHYHQLLVVAWRRDSIRRMWDALESDVIQKENLHERTIHALSDAAMGWRVRNPRYSKMAEVSPQSARNDLNALTRLGYLDAKGERKGRHYLAAQKLRAITAKTKEKLLLDDPFGQDGPKSFGDEAARGHPR